MYRSDLSPCPYRKDIELGTLNIGWLDKKHSYTQGEVSEEFLDRLFEFCKNFVLQTRGFHDCQFCPPKPSGSTCAEREGEKIWLGTAEIRVVYGDKVYAAPNLIYHYIIAHNYKPPDEFIQAVLYGLSPISDEYKMLTKKYWKF